MEVLIAFIIALLTALGVYLTLRARTYPVVLGLTMLAYAVNLFLFVMGRLNIDQAAILQEGVTQHADPLPQALVLTAIVISFGLQAFAIVLIQKVYEVLKTDDLDMIQKLEGDL